MSGGHFEYQQYHIREITESVEYLLEKISQPRPPQHKEKWIDVKLRQGESSWSWPMSVYEQIHKCETLDEAREKLRKLYSNTIKEVNGRFYHKHQTWTDKDGVKHPCEYELKQCESMDYDEGYEDTHYYGPDYQTETIEEFKRGLDYLQKAYVYAQRIDWLLSGDDGEENFHKRLKKDLKELEKGKKTDDLS